MKFVCRSSASIAAAAATLILAGAAVSPASYATEASVFAQDDTMSKEPMGKETMGKNTMGKEPMGKESMGKDAMAKDSMKKDEMNRRGHPKLSIEANVGGELQGLSPN